MTDAMQLRATSHHEVGAAIQREVSVIIKLWEARARAEQPSAPRAHHDQLLDHLPAFLAELGRSLASAAEDDFSSYRRPAQVHGDQRWELGWSLAEVVRDYQTLRLVLVDFLHEFLERPLSVKEVMALGLAIDEAIEVSVSSYVACGGSSLGSDPPRTESLGTALGSEEVLELFAVLGHELRNSLAPLTNSLHVLQLAGANAEIVEKTRLLMQRQVNMMVRLVEDLMDVPRLARNKLSLKTQRIDLSQLVREAAEDRLSAFQEAGIKLLIEVPPQPVWLMGDATRLNQVLGNLLSNALKFTHRGGTVTVVLRPDPKQGSSELKVCDSGIGIAPTLLPTIFEPFKQCSDHNGEQNRGGLGLGLALVKGLVELHGGRVAALSQGLGSGSEFVVQLPMFESTPLAIPTASAATRGVQVPRRVLVIDDNRDLTESTRMVLDLSGHDVRVAHGGAEGLAIAASVQPEVIICDIGLPDMNGYHVCEQICKDATLAAALKIALSGQGSNGCRELAIAAGFDLFLVKPVAPAQVAEIVANYKDFRRRCGN